MALLLAVGASRAGAQYIDDPAVRACVASIPASAFTRVPVFLVAEMPGEPAGPLQAAADAFTARVAARVRASLGARHDEVPAADSVFGWRHASGWIEMTVHRDGRHSWGPPETADLPTSSDTLGQALLERALQASVDAGEGMTWPEGAAGRSYTFELAYKKPEVARDLRLTMPRMRVTAPVFSMSVPWWQPMRVGLEPRIEYPPAALEARVEGKVILRFVVDTIGRVEASSVREVRGRGASRPMGGRIQEDFVSAVKQFLAMVRYTPATVGGCAVRQLVQQPFEFNFGR